MKEVLEALEGMEKQLVEIEAALSYYRELSRMQPDDRAALEELLYKSEYLKEHMLRQLYLLRKHAKSAHGTIAHPA